MDATEIIRGIMRREGVTGVELSGRLGRSRLYIGSKLSRQNRMRADTFAQICDAMEYDVIARNRYDGAEFFLSPSEED